MRTCPFDDCTRIIPEDLFVCQLHWHALTPAQRNRVWAAYSAYLRDELDLESLREVQAQVLLDAGQTPR